jgi:formate hydrogenlyase subunit 3/multisubunit Na+/H+ antiporter MnhD subunit
LGRILGHAAIVESGLTLLAIGLGTKEGLMIYFWLIIPRAAAFILWAVALSLIKQRTAGELRLSNIQGFGRLRPVLALSLLLAHFSLSGLPFLAGFPVRLVLWERLAGVFPVLAVGAILGNVGMLAGGLRTMSVFFTADVQEFPRKSEPLKEIPPGSTPMAPERLLSWSYFAISTSVVVFLGLFPSPLIPVLDRLVLVFEQLGG